MIDILYKYLQYSNKIKKFFHPLKPIKRLSRKHRDICTYIHNEPISILAFSSLIGQMLGCQLTGTQTASSCVHSGVYTQNQFST